MKFYEIPERCFLCGAVGEMAHHHLIPGYPGRKLSEVYGLVVPLCPRCHWRIHNESPEELMMLRQYGQRLCMYREKWTVDDWIKVFGKNYLKEEK
jgi:hypothetical protein